MTSAAPVAPKGPPEAVRIHQFTTTSGATTVEVGRKLVRCSSRRNSSSCAATSHRANHAGQGIAQALDAAEPDEVTSPTFTLIHEYDGHREAARELFTWTSIVSRRRAPTRDPGHRRVTHSSIGPGRVGRKVQEHPQKIHR